MKNLKKKLNKNWRNNTNEDLIRHAHPHASEQIKKLPSHLEGRVAKRPCSRCGQVGGIVEVKPKNDPHSKWFSISGTDHFDRSKEVCPDCDKKQTRGRVTARKDTPYGHDWANQIAHSPESPRKLTDPHWKDEKKDALTGRGGSKPTTRTIPTPFGVYTTDHEEQDKEGQAETTRRYHGGFEHPQKLGQGLRRPIKTPNEPYGSYSDAELDTAHGTDGALGDARNMKDTPKKEPHGGFVLPKPVKTKQPKTGKSPLRPLKHRTISRSLDATALRLKFMLGVRAPDKKKKPKKDDEIVEKKCQCGHDHSNAMGQEHSMFNSDIGNQNWQGQGLPQPKKEQCDCDKHGKPTEQGLTPNADARQKGLESGTSFGGAVRNTVGDGFTNAQAPPDNAQNSEVKPKETKENKMMRGLSLIHI